MNLKKIFSAFVALLATSTASANLQKQAQQDEGVIKSVLVIPENTELSQEEREAIMDLMQQIGVNVQIQEGNMLLMSKQGVTGDGDDPEQN